MSENNHFIKDIEIKKFKCFNSFKTGKFKRVNLIGGKNNIGKTAFMEAIYLYTSTSMTMAYQRLLILKTYRNMQEMLLSNDSDEDILKSLILENQDINIGIEKQGDRTNDDVGEEYISEGIFNIEKDKDDGLFSIRVKSEFVTINEGVYMHRDSDGDIEEEEEYYKTSSHKYSLSKLITFLHSNMSNAKYSTSKIFIGTNLNDNNLLEEIIGNLKLNNKYNSFNQHLNKLFKIENIDFINRKPMVKINNQYQNITTLGDGIRSIIFYLGSLLTLNDDYIFIDEIENGIHYSKLDDVWKLILTISKEQNVQVFATTHSKECIESYARVAKKLEDDNIGFISMYKNKENELKSITFDYESIQNRGELELDNR